MKNHLNLQELLQGCRNNDRRSQESIYQLFARPMFAVSIRYAADKSEAEDILQDAFIKIFTRLDSYTGSGSFEGWVRMIVVNTGISYYRKRKSLVEAMQQMPFEEAVRMLEHDSESMLLKTIAKLPGKLLVPFKMHALEGYSHKEIAAERGITEIQSRVSLSRARTRLKNTLTLSIQ